MEDCVAYRMHPIRTRMNYFCDSERKMIKAHFSTSPIGTYDEMFAMRIRIVCKRHSLPLTLPPRLVRWGGGETFSPTR